MDYNLKVNSTEAGCIIASLQLLQFDISSRDGKKNQITRNRLVEKLSNQINEQYETPTLEDIAEIKRR